MMCIIRTFILFYLVVLLRANRILFVMPYPAISHHIVARSLANNLAQNAEVVVLTYYSNFTAGVTPANVTEVDVSDAITGWYEALALINGKRSESYYTGYLGYAAALNTFLKLLKKPEVQKVLEDKFDLVIAESHFRPTVALARVCNTPLVHFSTTGTGFINDFEGSLTHYLYYPHVLRMRIYNLSAWEKLTEFYNNFYFQIAFEVLVKEHECKFEELFLFPLNDALRKEVQMTLLNSNALWDGNRAKPINVIYVEGINKPQQSELPQSLQTFLDSSNHGVIFISFGTSMVNSRLPRDRILAMVNVLASMPYDVLWKWDGELPGPAENIRVFKWLPQPDVLRHPKIKLFITQAGIHSTEEAINAGVPLLGIPLIADQWYNAEKYLYFKIGERLDLMDLTEECFKYAVETVINDEMYRRNVERLRVLIADQPLSPEQRVAWAIRRARSRRAGVLMRAPSAHMNIAQYYELPLISFVLLALLLIATLIILAVRRLWEQISAFNMTLFSLKKKKYVV